MPTTKACSASLAHPTGAATDRSEPRPPLNIAGAPGGTAGRSEEVKTPHPFCNGPFLAFYDRRERLGGMASPFPKQTRPAPKGAAQCRPSFKFVLLVTR
jgi:hypothetical protein